MSGSSFSGTPPHVQRPRSAEPDQSRQRSSDEIRADIERTRAQMDRTVDEIEERLTPEQIMKRMACAVGNGASSLAKTSSRKAVQLVREHPVPVAIVGAGLIGLFVARHKLKQRRQRRESGEAFEPGRYGETGISRAVGAAEGRFGEELSDVKDRAGHAKQRIREKLHDATEAAREKAHDVKEYARHAVQSAGETMSNVGHKIQRGAHQTREWFDDTLHDYPLAMGAGFFALGLAGGFSVPASRKEKEILGPVRDRLVDSAKEKGSELLERGKETAERAVDAAKEAVSEAGEELQGSKTQQSQQRGAGSDIGGARDRERLRQDSRSGQFGSTGQANRPAGVSNPTEPGLGVSGLPGEHRRSEGGAGDSESSSPSPQSRAQDRDSQRSTTPGTPPPSPGV